MAPARPPHTLPTQVPACLHATHPTPASPRLASALDYLPAPSPPQPCTSCLPMQRCSGLGPDVACGANFVSMPSACSRRYEHSVLAGFLPMAPCPHSPACPRGPLQPRRGAVWRQRARPPSPQQRPKSRSSPGSKPLAMKSSRVGRRQAAPALPACLPAFQPARLIDVASVAACCTVGSVSKCREVVCWLVKHAKPQD